MAKRAEDDRETKEQLWSQLEKGFASMLRIEGSDQHPQPMSHFADRDAGVIWFIHVIADRPRAGDRAWCGRGHDLHLQVAGLPREPQGTPRDRGGRREAGRNSGAFPSQPGSSMAARTRASGSCAFRPAEAAIWASDANRLLVGLKMLRAGTTEGARCAGCRRASG